GRSRRVERAGPLEGRRWRGVQHRRWRRDQWRGGRGPRAGALRQARLAAAFREGPPRPRLSICARGVPDAPPRLAAAGHLPRGAEPDGRLVSPPRGLVAQTEVAGILGLLPAELPRTAGERRPGLNGYPAGGGRRAAGPRPAADAGRHGSP